MSGRALALAVPTMKSGSPGLWKTDIWPLVPLTREVSENKKVSVPRYQLLRKYE